MNIELIPVTPFQQNCSLIWSENRDAAIIDPGGEADKLIERITALKLNLTHILLTHGHLDHVGAAQALQAKYNVPIWGSQQEDLFLFESLPEQARLFGLQTVNAFVPDRWLNEGEILNINDFSFEIKHLPGHTPGHIGFIEHQKKLAFTGDVLFQHSIGRTDFPRGDHQTLLNSIREKLFLLPDEMVIIAGHGPYTTIGREKAQNPFLK